MPTDETPKEENAPLDSDAVNGVAGDRAGGANGNTNGANENGHSVRLSHAELRDRFLAQTEGRSCLIAEPLDSGLWPTAGLSDRQVELLTEALRKVRRYELDKAP